MGRLRANLEASPLAGEREDLACFRPAGGCVDSADVATDLVWLGGDTECEHWIAGDRAHRDEADGLVCMESGGLLLISTTPECPPTTDPVEPTREAYRRIIECARARGYPAPVRLWNYLPAINLGAGDRERYRRFCIGRNHALEQLGISWTELCAATAVGTHGERLLVHGLAARSPGHAIENPRQVAAYRYPRRYGPRAPLFARATAIERDDGGHSLLVSGTASIVGHETLHPDDLMAQVEETVQNLETLLGEAATSRQDPGLAAFDQRSLLRVYVRERERAAEIEARLRAAWPQAHLMLLEADLCRSDLGVEIEAFHTSALTGEDPR